MECRKEEEEFSFWDIINQLNVYKRLKKSNKTNWLTEEGTIANAFPVAKTNAIQEVELKGDLVEITDNFNKEWKVISFSKYGFIN